MTWLGFALAAFAIASWCSTALLVRAAIQSPRIGALTERAAIAVILSVFGSVCVILVLNTDSGQALFPLEVARIVFRVCLLALLFIPVYWLGLYLTNRLGGGR